MPGLRSGALRSKVASREVGASYNALLNDASDSDKPSNAGWTAFGGYRLQFRENESERIVERACTVFGQVTDKSQLHKNTN
jgi:hypothetical protein